MDCPHKSIEQIEKEAAFSVEEEIPLVVKEKISEDKEDPAVPVVKIEGMAAASAVVGTAVAENLVSSERNVELDNDKPNVDESSQLPEGTSVNNPILEIDTEEEEDCMPLCKTMTPTNTPIMIGSEQASPRLQSSSDSLDDEGQSKVVNSTAPKTVEVPVTPEKPVKNKSEGKESKKDEKKKSKKKEDKGIEYILRALNSLQRPEEKLAALCKKYSDLHEEHRVLQTSFKTQQRTMAVVMREKEQLQSEHTKAMMAKSKLESLCRELQKHNKIIKEESIKRAREEDERRKEISAQFQKTIGEIQIQMSDNIERNGKLRQENGDLAAQLQNIIKQCEARESQIDKVRKQHDLEQQLAAAKLAKSDLQLREEQEKNSREKELLITKFTEQAKKSNMLEAQVEMFKERYDDFEKLHSRSNETFQKYKTEMDKMTKRIKKLEKDGMHWKNKFEGSNKSLLEMAEGRNKSEKETIVYIQKCKKLESLCRALQGELHGKKPCGEQTKQEQHDSDADSKDQLTSSASVPPNSPEASSGQCSPDSIEATHLSSSNPPGCVDDFSPHKSDSLSKPATAIPEFISQTPSPEVSMTVSSAAKVTSPHQVENHGSAGDTCASLEATTPATTSPEKQAMA